jgi:menaquinone-dependent protoporphyrinogen oxidase
MKTLILFSTKYGSVEKTARLLAGKLEGDTVIRNINEGPPELDGYDNIIFGGSIYVGKIQNELKFFISDNLDTLLAKNVGLFVNAGEPDELEMKKQLDNSFPRELLDKAVAVGVFGHAVDLTKVTLIEKILLRLLKGVKASYEQFYEDRIAQFADKINPAQHPQ